MIRHLHAFDRFLMEADTALRTICIPPNRHARRASPANTQPEHPLSSAEKQHVAKLMRVNHAGEVCAQALYQGHALTSRQTALKTQMQQAATEEIEHLAWCEERLRELGGSPSHLNPFWYAGSLLLGALAGLIGDAWSLGFVAETERQVSAHLARHIEQLPANDAKTKALLLQMKEDEATHAETAFSAGGSELPPLIKYLMHGVSKLLTLSSQHI